MQYLLGKLSVLLLKNSGMNFASKVYISPSALMSMKILDHDNEETNAITMPSLSASLDRAGKFVVQPKQVKIIGIIAIQICIFRTSCLFWLFVQVLNWFQNRRYAQRAKLGKAPDKLTVSPMPREDSTPFRNMAPPISGSSGTLDKHSCNPITQSTLLISSSRCSYLVTLMLNCNWFLWYRLFAILAHHEELCSCSNMH